MPAPEVGSPARRARARRPRSLRHRWPSGLLNTGRSARNGREPIVPPSPRRDDHARAIISAEPTTCPRTPCPRNGHAPQCRSPGIADPKMSPLDLGGWGDPEREVRLFRAGRRVRPPIPLGIERLLEDPSASRTSRLHGLIPTGLPIARRPPGPRVLAI